MEKKDRSDPQPDSTIQPKAKGSTPYGARVLRAPYMIKVSGHDHLTASEQPEVLGELLDASEGSSEATRGTF